MSTDKDWEEWGATDPYFGVYSDDKFRKKQLNESSRIDFFESGEKHIEYIFQLIEKNFKLQFNPGRALDFGCGVGRLLLPLAKKSGIAVGVDISHSMLAETKSNADSFDVKNIELVLSDDKLSNATGEFSLIHSYIVFQHIPWKRGKFIIQELSSKVEKNGFIAVHFLTSSSASKFSRAIAHLRYKFRPLHFLWNFIKRRKLLEPPMQLHIYNLDEVINDLKQKGFDTPICSYEPDMDGFTNLYVLAQRKHS